MYGVGHKNRFPKSCKTLDQLVQADVLFFGVCREELENAENCRLHVFKGDDDLVKPEMGQVSLFYFARTHCKLVLKNEVSRVLHNSLWPK